MAMARTKAKKKNKTKPSPKAAKKTASKYVYQFGKKTDGTLSVLGSGAFPLPGGQPLSQEIKDRARRLVE